MQNETLRIDKIVNKISNIINLQLKEIKTITELELLVNKTCNKNNMIIDDYLWYEGCFDLEDYIKDKQLKIKGDKII